jgi:hypothetical protein
MELKANHIVWTGISSDEYITGQPYYIIITAPCNLEDTDSGCWCPEEAVDFLNHIGINASSSIHYSSGYKAPGCTWISGKEHMSPEVRLAYNAFTGIGNNKSFAYLLQKPED